MLKFVDIPQFELGILLEINELTGKVFHLVDNIIQGSAPSFTIKGGHISGIRLCNCGLESFPRILKYLKHLEILDLSNSELKENINKIHSLPESIGNLRSITHLNLKSNFIEELPESIGLLGNLRELNLDYNNISSLPNSMSNLDSLTSLYLRTSNIETLPEFLTKLKSLKMIDLWGCNLTNLYTSIKEFKKKGFVLRNNVLFRFRTIL